MKQTTVRQFFQQFPSDEACLEHLFNVRFGQDHECPKYKRSTTSPAAMGFIAASSSWWSHKQLGIL
ncbi:hypothetical protein SLH47_26055 [Cognatiyoonia sp. IB215182]|nr:hypothetical protein [Cognatiyoonia sp. IB215182]MDX8355828.1 hypothetical protein [Cognatiyoonia sp. IB215182]